MIRLRRRRRRRPVVSITERLAPYQMRRDPLPQRRAA